MSFDVLCTVQGDCSGQPLTNKKDVLSEPDLLFYEKILSTSFPAESALQRNLE